VDCSFPQQRVVLAGRPSSEHFGLVRKLKRSGFLVAWIELGAGDRIILLDGGRSPEILPLKRLVEDSEDDSDGDRARLGPDSPPGNLLNSLGMNMLTVPDGLFPTGTGEIGVIHRLRIADFPVTNEQWRRFELEEGYDGAADCPGIDAYSVYDGTYLQSLRQNRAGFADASHPVVCISWHNAVKFAAWLTRMERYLGVITRQFEYRLPTELEWEYCCRAGMRSRYWYGDQADASLMNYLELIGHPTLRGARPNPWGLYDCHGNTFEWCANESGAPLKDVVSEPTAAGNRANRGGSWASVAESCTSEYRHWNQPLSCHNRLGFRLVLAPASDKAQRQ
jgi:formylglycine-generating enzyme required for sulfatase activity